MTISTSTANKLLLLIILVSGITLIAGTVHTYDHIPPVPDAVETEEGEPLFDRSDIKEGQSIFQKRNLMGYGTLLGNGSYYGPDYTAETLEWAKGVIREDTSTGGENEEGRSLSEMIRPVRIDGETVVLHAPWARAFRTIQNNLNARFVEGSLKEGIPPETLEPAEIKPLAAFFTWTSLFSITERGDSGYSYTNNFPPDAEIGNVPTTPVIAWSAWTVALVLFIAMIFIVIYRFVDFRDPPELPELERKRGEGITFLQKTAIFLLAGCTVVYLLQTLAGGYIANAYVSRESFYGIFEVLGLERMKVLPFRAVRTAHTSMAVIWVVGMWMSGSLYVAFLLGGKEKKWHRPLTYVSVAILVLSIVGTLVGVYLSTVGVTGDLWYLWGTEGTEYLEMGRLWRMGIGAGFVIWTVVLISVLWNADVRWQSFLNLLMINGAGITIAFFASFLYSPDSHWVIIDFWRWWVVHHWVEGIFAFFQLLVLGWFLAGLNLVTRQEVTKSLYLEGALILLAGFLAVGHHFWWVGQPPVWIGVGSVFSTLELVPLFLLLASALHSISKQSDLKPATYHRLPLYFFLASAFWQFFGSGVLGGLINLPVVNYYEHGTFLTVAHSHASFLGAFGFLALGLLVYCCRHAFPDHFRTGRLWWGFWLMNAGLFLMVVLSLIPIGVLQLNDVIQNGYAGARSLAFYEGEWVTFFNELRLPGDTLIILGAGLFVYELVPGIISQLLKSGEDAE